MLRPFEKYVGFRQIMSNAKALYRSITLMKYSKVGTYNKHESDVLTKTCVLGIYQTWSKIILK